MRRILWEPRPKLNPCSSNQSDGKRYEQNTNSHVDPGLTIVVRRSGHLAQGQQKVENRSRLHEIVCA
jgi:hypothetical protein